MSKTSKPLAVLAVALIAGGVRAADSTARVESQAITPARSEADSTAPRLDGAQLFATHCAMCHKPMALARRLQTASVPDEAKAKMTTFLAHHARSDAAADAAIIDYLADGKFP